MTIDRHVSYLRTLIKQESDDSYWSDQFLYSTLVDARAELLYNNINKYKNNSQNYQSFCVGVSLQQYHDCSCIDNPNCLVLISSVDIPRAMQIKSQPLIKVMNYQSNTEYHPSNPLFEKRLKIYTRTKKEKIGWEIRNRKLIVFNNTNLKVVKVRLLPEDPLELANINTCTELGETLSSSCYDIYSQDFPIEAHLNNPMYDLALRKLGLSLQMPEDVTNDGQSAAQKI